MAAITNKIYIGSLVSPDFYFENDSIMSANVVQNVALVGTELSIDSFTPVVMDNEDSLHDLYRFRSSDGQEIQTGIGELFCIDVDSGTNVSDLIYLDNGTPVWYYQDDTLIGKFYVKSVDRVGRNQYQLNTVSAIGMLDEMEHGGGLFTTTTFGAVLTHILAKGIHGSGNAVIDYAIDDDVSDLPVSGWLPHDTKRNNLYRLVFANGVNIVKNYDGNPRFTFLYTTAVGAQPIDSELVYNQGSVSYEKPYTNVVVMEHTYTPLTTEDAVTLFDNTTGTAASNTEIWFDHAPIIVSTITATGLTLVSATENSAIVTGNGTLTGIPYLHDTRAVNMGDSSASDEKTIKVEDATFVNLINSENLLKRLYAYYCPEDFIHTINDGIVYDGQRCGKVYKLSDPYGHEETAFLIGMNITASAVNKADCEWRTHYEPAGQAGLYQDVEIDVPEPDPEDPTQIITEGDWTVPEGVTQFKVVLIGGGTGGGSGWPGENGEDAYCHTEVESTADLSAVWYGAEGGDGGAGGSGGSPGRVKVVVVENAVPGTVYHWSLGSGGEGGAATGFIPDTFDELKNMLEDTDPDTTYTTAQINAMIATEQSLSGWNGSPNTGSAGTATTFTDGTTTWSTADNDGYTPTGGIYEPITNQYFALAGKKGIKGGKGGARKVENNGSFNWVTDGENVTGDDGTIWRGGSTGRSLNSVSGLPEAKLIAYGGNGAGAAVGIDRSTNSHINGGSDQSASWNVTQDE